MFDFSIQCVKRVRHTEKAFIILDAFAFLAVVFFVSYLSASIETTIASSSATSVTITTGASEDTSSNSGGTFLQPVSLEVNIEPSEKHPEIPKSLLINNSNIYTNSLTVVLNLSVQNAFQMAISNSPDFNGVSWEDYNISKSWNLNEGESEKIVYAKFRSTSGGVSEVVSDSIIFDITAPVNVNLLEIKSGDEKIKLSWSNPKDSDFAGVKIVHSQENYPLNLAGGKTIYDGSENFFVDLNLENKISYFYTIFSYDQAGNYSSGAIIFATPKSLPDSKIIPEEIIPEIPPKISPEIPSEIIPLIPSQPQPPVIPPFIPEEKIEIADFSLKIKTDLGVMPLNIYSQKQQESNEIKIIKGAPLVISIPADKFKKEIKTVTASITNDVFSSSYLLKADEKSKSFETVITAPLKKGKYNLILNVIYKDGTSDTVFTEILIDPYGYIYERIKNQELRITNAEVTLYKFNSSANEWQKWFAEKYKQKNPQITDETGEYFFMVPPGKYYLKVVKENYYSQETVEFEVIDEIVNINIEIKEVAFYKYKEKFGGISTLFFLGFLGIALGILAYKKIFKN